jgi:cobalt-zinc-cadmium efflux system protein
MNVCGAFVHMPGDAAASAGVGAAGLLTALTGWLWIDPAVSLLLAALITWGTWGLARDSFNLAVDAVPRAIDLAAVQTYLRGLGAVEEVHDLRVWGTSTTEVALTAHLVRPTAGGENALLSTARRALRERFVVAHVTLQLEHGRMDEPCDGREPAVPAATAR